jgi:maltose/maltodextrin transport system permease protein
MIGPGARGSRAGGLDVEVPAPRTPPRPGVLHVALAASGVLALLAALALVWLLIASRQQIVAGAVLAGLGVAVWIYLHPRCYAWRYVLPGVLAVLVFVVLPMAYTLAMGFTNYSSRHLLSFERATAVLLSRSNGDGAGLDFRLQREAEHYRLAFTDDGGRHFRSGPLALGAAQRIPLAAAEASDTAEGLPLKEVIAQQAALAQLTAVLPDGTELHLSSLRRFVASRPAYRRNADGSLTDTEDGTQVEPNFSSGYWERADGSPLTPGFRTTVGWQNYALIFTEARFLQPFLRVFAWTVSFATLNTLFTFSLGLVLAVVLNWESLGYRPFYRAMLFVPYAVPAFISIPVFRGLFNENLGEVNLILDQLFGIRPAWFSDVTLARSMVLIVNTWLGYPYMMILCMGLIKAIPAELYEAAVLAGAGPLTTLLHITLPLIARPIAPLLIASFAFNFNNLTLIALLTEGAPDFLDTELPVGATDLLASYTYRIAFHDSGQEYALSCAISSIVFLIVAALAIVNLRLFKVGREAA